MTAIDRERTAALELPSCMREELRMSFNFARVVMRTPGGGGESTLQCYV